jgi:surface antigen
MSDEETIPTKPRRFSIRDGVMFGAGAIFGAAALYAGYRIDPVPGVVQLTRSEIQHLIDDPTATLLSTGYKGKIAIVNKLS